MKKLTWHSGSLANIRYFAQIGAVEASVRITREGDKYFWMVDVRGSKSQLLDRGDGCPQLFELSELEEAKKAAVKFATKILND